jgi:phenylalanyl-tRNA synthetase beta chain
VLELAGVSGVKFTACTDNAAYHPGRCAAFSIQKNGKTVDLGLIGQIHPAVASDYGFDKPVFCASVYFDELWAAADMTIDYKPLPKFPAVSRDFSFICDESLEVGAIEEVMAKAAGKLCKGVKLFDIFRGEKIGEDKKSVAFRVILRAPDRTLTVEEADKVSNKIIKDLAFKLGLNIRG